MAVYYPKFLVLFSFICLYVLDKYMSFVVTNVCIRLKFVQKEHQSMSELCDYVM